jgi:hypothetical protein
MNLLLRLPTPEVILSASQIIAEIKSADRSRRERRFAELFTCGHVPTSARVLVPVSIIIDAHLKITLAVSRDYVALGTEDDHIRVPLNPIDAQHIADAVDCMLPTTMIVDHIWRASTKLAPNPWGPPYDASMLSVSRLEVHSRQIDERLSVIAVPVDRPIAGIKKDVVLSNRLTLQPNRVAIYGWHRTNGIPIQPLSLIHESSYADYSHGIRLVSLECEVNGVKRDLRDVLRDATLARLLSHDGVLNVIRQPCA